MLKLLSVFYSVYVGLLFGLALVLVSLTYPLAMLLAERPKLTMIYAINRYAMRVWGVLTGIRLRVEGQAAWVPAPVIVGNHCNMLDMAICAMACVQPVKLLAKAEFARLPVLGFMFRTFAVLVERESAESRRAGVKVLSSALKAGWPIFIFPEGTRNRITAPLQAFKDGAFRTAIAAQAPIQPFVQLRMREVQLHNQLLFRPGRPIFRWLPPISTIGMTEEDLPALRDRVYALIEAELRRDDPAFAL
ncbi:lysophospholipid acyltransferase family protein [Chitinimonas sp. PSY-7]